MIMAEAETTQSEKATKPARVFGAPWSETMDREEAAAYLGISVQTLERRVAKAKIRSYKDGWLRKFRRVDLDEYRARLVEQEAATYQAARKAALQVVR